MVIPYMVEHHHQVRRKGLACDEKEFSDTHFHMVQSLNICVMCHHNEESWSDLFPHSPVIFVLCAIIMKNLGVIYFHIAL
jgi:hypothetical protein